jgi:hypothetical protein
MKFNTTPTTSAIPIDTGNATASPAISIAATSRRFARLKMAPPTRVETMLEASAAWMLFTKLEASWPLLPMVRARIREIRKMPIA